MSVTRWSYAAEDARGAIATGVLDAASREDAAARLKARALQPLRLDQEKPLLRGLTIGGASGRLPVSMLSGIARRLADLTQAGLPLASALKLAAEQARTPRERAYLSGLETRLKAGDSLSVAIDKAEAKTPRLFQALIDAGEALGALGDAFARLAQHYEERQALRREITAQLLYPAFLLVMIFATFLFLAFVVLPQFQSVFSMAGAAPPPETRFVMAAGEAIRGFWWTAPIAVIAITLFIREMLRRQPIAIERLILALPFVGAVSRDAASGAYLRTLSALLLGGLSLSKAMPIASASVSLATTRATLGSVETQVRGGARLGRALRGLSAIPSDLVSFVEIGDETGNLGKMCAEAASVAEKRLARRLKAAAALLSPVLTALMGLMTAGVIAAVMLGVLSLNDVVG